MKEWLIFVTENAIVLIDFLALAIIVTAENGVVFHDAPAERAMA